mgnify:CR=1 FL=1
MPLSVDKGLAAFEKKLAKLPEASQKIAIALAPKTSKLVGESFSSQASPVGAPWPATKSGAPAFGGSGAMGYVLSRLAGKLTVRTSVLYPLHFHQDGTHVVGKKRGRRIASKITGAYVGNVLKSLGLKGSAPRQRKGESDDAYKARVAKFTAAKQARTDARGAARRHASAAVQEARTAGGWHDPPRPMLPGEDDPPPPRWEETIRTTARDVMAQLGADEVSG